MHSSQPRLQVMQWQYAVRDLLQLVDDIQIHPLICHVYARSPHPSGALHCIRSGNFTKPVLNTDKCKLKAVSFMELNLYVEFIR
jgi:hypothetical protein